MKLVAPYLDKARSVNVARSQAEGSICILPSLPYPAMTPGAKFEPDLQAVRKPACKQCVLRSLPCLEGPGEKSCYHCYKSPRGPCEDAEEEDEPEAAIDVDGSESEAESEESSLGGCLLIG